MAKFSNVDELTTEQRLLVVGWMVEAIDMGMKKQIQTRAYAAFVSALQRGSGFSVKKIWQSLPESTKLHFDHGSDILLMLQDEIGQLEDQLDQEIQEESEQDEDDESTTPDQLDGDGVKLGVAP